MHGGVFVFLNVFSDFFGQVGVFENFGDEVFVEDGPGLSVLRSLRVEFLGEQMSDSFRAGAGLAGQGDEGEVRGAGQRGAILLADEVGTVFGEIICIGHNRILTGWEHEAEGGSGMEM